MTKISNYELKALIEERIEAGEISIEADREGGIPVENSTDDIRVYIRVNETKPQGEAYEDRFLRKTGIKRDKDGTPDIVGKVMGDYHNSIRKAHAQEIIRPNCEICKEKIDLLQVYSTRQEKGSEIIKYYHNKCRIKEGTSSTESNWNGTIKDNDK